MRRKPVQREKHEQAAIVQLLRSIGAAVYVLGTRRPAGKPCPTCGTFVPEHQGTRQTPGLPDLYVVLPRRDSAYARDPLWIEVKAAAGRLSEEQQTFQTLADLGRVGHVVGGIDAVIAWLVDRGYLRTGQVPHYRLPAAARNGVGSTVE